MSEKESFNPRTIEEALDLLHRLEERPVKIIAGGTDLMVKMKDREIDPECLIDITGIAGLTGVRISGDHLEVGPIVTHYEATRHPLIIEHAPVVSEGCAKVGSPQIRHRGTIGGNICTGSPAGDSLPPLAILNSRFILSSVRGERVSDFADFFLGPQKTDIRPGELLTRIEPEKIAPGEKYAFLWLGMRKALTVTKVSIAARCRLNDGVLNDVRIALGSVASTVIRASTAEKTLENRNIGSVLIEEAVEAVRVDATPIDDVRSTAAYRKHAAGILLKRFLESLSHDE